MCNISCVIDLNLAKSAVILFGVNLKYLNHFQKNFHFNSFVYFEPFADTNVFFWSFFVKAKKLKSLSATGMVQGTEKLSRYMTAHYTQRH